MNAPPSGSAGDARSRHAYAWFVAVALGLAYLMSLLDRFLISVTLEPLKNDLVLTDTQLGLLSGPAFAVLYALFCPIMGRLSDVMNRCYLIAAGMLVWSASTAAIAFSDSYPAILSARALVGMGEACLVPAGTSLLAAYFAREQLGRATSVFLSGASIGKAIAFIGGGALLAVLTVSGGLHIGRQFSPWQSLFILAALPGIALALLFLFIRDPGREVTKLTRHARASDLLAHLRPRKQAYILHVLAATIVVMGSAVFLSWSPSFFAREFGLKPANAAIIAGLATVVVGPLGYWIGGAAMDRLLRHGVTAAPPLLIAGSLALAIPACAVFTLSDNLWLAVAGYAVAQFAVQMPGAPSIVGLQFMTPTAHRGAVIGIYLVVVTLGSIGIGPALVGVINDSLFAGRELGKALLLVVAGFAVVGALCSMQNRRAFARALIDAA